MIPFILATTIALSPIGDGLDRIQDDDSRWICSTMGDQRCGPDNSNGLTPGCYDDSGSLVAPWPCYVIINQDGSAEIYQ